MDEHLRNFDNGASRLQGKESFNEFTAPTGYVGRDSSGHPLANDSNGSCYWTTKSEMDDIWKHHDHRLAEHELGFDENSMRNGMFHRIDLDNPHEHNARIASGYELGANDHFTGNIKDAAGNNVKDEYGHNKVDPDIYDKKTSSGLFECVTDKSPLSECTVSEPRTFDSPIEQAKDQCYAAADISKMDVGPQKESVINSWNDFTQRLDARMAGEQDYLSKRIADHEKTMANNPVDSLEYNRAAQNKAWCENYSRELGESCQKLQAQYANLNGGASMPTESKKQAENGPVSLSEIPQPPNPKQNGEPEPMGAKKEDLPPTHSRKASQGSSAGPASLNEITPSKKQATKTNGEPHKSGAAQNGNSPAVKDAGLVGPENLQEINKAHNSAIANNHIENQTKTPNAAYGAVEATQKLKDGMKNG